MTIKSNTDLHISIAVVEGSQREWNHRALQPILYDMIALGRILKQLHWNVIGAHFRPIHLHLDEIYEFVDNAVDEVAERLAATGHSPSGRMCDVAEHSELEDAPSGFIEDSEVLRFAEHSVRRLALFIRSRTEELENSDAPTSDMLHQIALGLEKHHWMLQAQRI